ncbi:MAG: spermidine/putrescine ABC transporter permease PotB [Shewanellaceae bacterium]|nr:spermidine/putrescine ABC transporter permease PotB [Shewanellaceae bacterium]
MIKQTSHFKTFSIACAFIWLLVFVLIPHLLIGAASLLSYDSVQLVAWPLTLENYLNLLDISYLHIFLHSIWLAGLSSFICLLIGYPVAWIITRYSLGTQRLLLLMLIIPFWTNSLIRTYAIKIILSTKGVLNWCLLSIGLIDKPLHLLYTEAAVVIGLVYILLPFMILPLYAAIEKLPSIYQEASMDLGANRWQFFYKIMLPLTSSGIIAGILMVFLPAMGMFYLSDLLGGSKQVLVGNLIKDQILIHRNWPFAASASLTLLFIMTWFIVFYFRSTKATKTNTQDRLS